jgi:hypothetical protein
MTNTAITTMTKIDRSNKGIDIEAIRTCILIQGMSHRQAAKALNCSKSLITEQCKKYSIISRGTLKQWASARTAILQDKGRMLLDAMTPEVLKKASINNMAYAAQTLYNMERLEMDKSTSNVSVLHASDYDKTATELDAAYEELDQ